MAIKINYTSKVIALYFTIKLVIILCLTLFILSTNIYWIHTIYQLQFRILLFQLWTGRKYPYIPMGFYFIWGTGRKLTIKNKNEGGEFLRWQSSKMWSPPAPTNTSKIYLHMECFIQKILLNAGKRSQNSDRASKSAWLGRTKEKRKKMRKESGWHLHPYEGAGKEEKFLHPGKYPHWQGDQLGQRRIFGVSEVNTAISLFQLKWKQSCLNSQCYCPVLPSLKQQTTGVGRGCKLKLRLWRPDSGR